MLLYIRQRKAGQGNWDQVKDAVSVKSALRKELNLGDQE